MSLQHAIKVRCIGSVVGSVAISREPRSPAALRTAAAVLKESIEIPRKSLRF
jgi:hypothetical protein